MCNTMCNIHRSGIVFMTGHTNITCAHTEFYTVDKLNFQDKTKKY